MLFENLYDILIDPPEKGIGLRSPKLEADILLSTRPGGAGLAFTDLSKAATGKKISNKAFLIFGPGEYDVKGTYIQGIAVASVNNQSLEQATIYTIESEGMKICHLGLLSQEELKSEQLEKIGDIDILIVPIGGGKTIDAKGAVKIMSQIEPKIIIPMYYRIPNLKIKLDGLDKFFKTLGIKSLEALPKLSIREKDISEEEAKIIALKP